MKTHVKNSKINVKMKAPEDKLMKNPKAFS